MSDLHIRNAAPDDAPIILALLGELAAYEQQPFELSEAAIVRDMLGDKPVCRCDLAFWGGAPAGIASWYWAYKSFGAARGIYLEDLFVRPEFRGRGTGRALLAHLAAIAARESGFMEWRVLDWNASSIEFYKSLGGKPQEAWVTYRLQGEALLKLASP
nr:Acetyltransferase (GNAT) family [uncultured bacterium]